MTYRAPKGTDDILPPASRVWARLERAFFDLIERFGYGLTMTPMFEATELFARGVGEATDVVEKQMYTFEDKAGRSLTLRPEVTASVVRALIQAGGVNGIFKGAYWGPTFRYERPQRGRRRQFHQAGVEYVGATAAEADAEVIEFGYRLLEAMEISDVEVQLNSIGDPPDRVAYRDRLVEYLEGRADRLSPEARRRITTNPIRVLDSKADRAVVADAPVPIDHLGPEAVAHLGAVRDHLERLEIPYALDATLVRGLDYYNRTVWEYVPRDSDAAQSSLGGGGRYDGLFELLGGAPTPAVGLAMGLDRIVLAMGEGGEPPSLDVWVIIADVARTAEAATLASGLRGAGLRVDLDLAARSVKSQFRQADRRGSRIAVVVGEEWDSGMVVVRDLSTGEQAEIVVEEIAAWLQDR